MGAPAELVDRLNRAGQGHLLRFHDELAEASRRRLLAQIDALDLEALPRLVEEYVKRKPALALPAGVEPAPYYPNDPGSSGRTWDRAKFKQAGEDLVRAGRVGAFTVAGGQGSRLGFDGPKGCFPAGAVTGKPLFQVFAEGLLAAGRTYGRPLPWYVMTSPQNHADTQRFFREHAFFGLAPGDVMFFEQGVMPSLELGSGRVLMAAKDELATNPDGHGGSIKALWVSGAIQNMQRRGVEHLSYFQVDNPIVRVVDPVFLGLHAGAPDSSGEMSSKMIPKAYPEEKLGVFCATPNASGGRRLEVIEYSDLPMELQRQRLADGSLRFLAGSIAVHAMSVEFLTRLNTDPSFSLPYHRAEKKVACFDPESGGVGGAVEPKEPNAVKLERFVFDALPMCRASVVYETDRIEEFAPIKNATGVDSVESSRRVQTERAARWLERAGVKVPRRGDGTPDCVLEVGPLTAMEAGDLNTGVALPEAIERGARVVV